MKNKRGLLFAVILVLTIMACLITDGDKNERLTPDVPCCVEQHTPEPTADYH